MSAFVIKRFVRVAPVLTLVILAWLALASVASAQDRKATLTLSVPEAVPAGSIMELVATLTEKDGAPIAGEMIDFAMSVEFMSNSGEIHIGSGMTNGSGVARIEYMPKAEGEHYITARSSESSEVSAFSEVEMTVTPGPQLYGELSPIRVPGANVWMTSAVLFVVWSIFVLISLRIWQIARIGEREGSSPDA